jgi:hypothetical protein
MPCTICWKFKAIAFLPIGETKVATCSFCIDTVISAREYIDNNQGRKPAA